MSGSEELLTKVDSSLSQSHDLATACLQILNATLPHFNCVTGSIHQLDRSSNSLTMLAQRGIPDAIIDRVRMIPIGKGMAGLAAERLAPVQVCNLQTDTSGVAKPGAKMTEMKGSIAVPMMYGSELCGTIGIAKPQEHNFNEGEQQLLLEIGRRIAARLKI